ncbi:MAG: CotH kinase family protein [Balneolaceae bacterium]|nr:CotH kinase family protein [Balneolaceae bacterium]MBO6545900.1 CotH kinase family protein [Balneolaceae bacterium]MBO6647296.1 CotH kinase family protein [Balneolaceae bacterium]
MKKTFFIFLLTLVFFRIGFTQTSEEWVFDDTVLSEVYIIIEPDSLAEILDFDNRYSDYEYPATFVFVKGEERDTVENIGFRLRGNTSRDSQKKSFKVSFNTFVPGREYHGLDKMNLNGEHNDPSIIRSKLSWDIFENYDVPAPRANHVKLYINEEYFGLYINVEHIDNEFVQDRFEGDEGNLYKNLWPADLSYISENPNDYKWSPDWADRRVYDLKTNTEDDDYSDLASLISFLEHSDQTEFINQIEDYINVDGVLLWMAVDVLTGNWDNYWYNQNNYYLYFNTSDQRLEFIPYDYDNTFGIDWVGQDWGERDINNWGRDDKPLTNRILEVTEYRNRLHFYINKIIEEYFNEEVLFGEIDRLKAMTETAAEADTFRTLDYDYGIAEYHASFNSALGGHVDYGLKPYITARVTSALEQLSVVNITPIIKKVKTNFTFFNDQETLTIKATLLDDNSELSVKAEVTIDVTTTIDLLDDGNGRDKEANDGIYTGTFIPGDYEGIISYFITATDPSAKTQRFPNNPDDVLEEQVGQSSSPLVINELMASNSSTIADEGGAFADWLEIYNPGDIPVSLNGYYLSDNLTRKDKWAFPDTTIAPNEYLLVWVDDDEKEGPLHASFNLSKDGEDIGLFELSGETFLTVDAFSFSEQQTDISYGRNGDGGEEFVLFDSPTPGGQNGLINSNESGQENPSEIQLLQNYPNPFNPSTNITFELEKTSNVKLEVFSVEGRLIQTLADSRYNSGAHSIRFDASSLSSGIYFYRLSSESQSITRRLVLIK